MFSGIQSSMFHDTKDFSELITGFVGVINTLLIDFVSLNNAIAYHEN